MENSGYHGDIDISDEGFEVDLWEDTYSAERYLETFHFSFEQLESLLEEYLDEVGDTDTIRKHLNKMMNIYSNIDEKRYRRFELGEY